MASPRLETFCCPNRDAATDLVVTFQPTLFSALSIGSGGLSFIFTILQILPKRKGYRRLGQYPLPKPTSSSRILFIISICDLLGCAEINAENLRRCQVVSSVEVLAVFAGNQWVELRGSADVVHLCRIGLQADIYCIYFLLLLFAYFRHTCHATSFTVQNGPVL